MKTKIIRFEIDGYRIVAQAIVFYDNSYKVKYRVRNKQTMPPIDHRMTNIIRESARSLLWNEVHYAELE